MSFQFNNSNLEGKVVKAINQLKDANNKKIDFPIEINKNQFAEQATQYYLEVLKEKKLIK